MSRPARFTKADVQRAISGFVASGQALGRVLIRANGEIEILPKSGKPVHDNDEWADLE